MMSAVWTCPNCGSDMRKITEMAMPCYVCNSCGCSLEAEEKNFSNGSVCPNCHRLIDDDIECPHCGYDPGSDFD